MAEKERYLSTTQVAKKLNLSPKTIERKLRAGWFFGAVRFGRLWRVPETAIDAWLERNAKMRA
jgi:excisionase family DNA binding protein